MFTILDVAAKAEHMAQVDPHGWIITLVSVSVVFCSLFLLYIAYTIVGKLSAEKPQKNEESGGETEAAIALALHQYLNDTVHDEESYIITIKRK